MPRPCSACAVVSIRPDPESFIQAERAVIIWDEAHKTEHFIRQAEISSSEPDLGFLVPTPTTPELVEADPKIFDMAFAIGAPTLIPPTISRKPMDILWPLALGPLVALGNQVKGVTSMPNMERVTVVFQTEVGGYQATVLAADDPAALAQWLKDNGYTLAQGMEEWLKPYVAAKWKITAFKLLKPSSPDSADAITTRAIRMSFTTDRPFFPYSEPGDKAAAREASPWGRALRVAILSNHRMKGELQDGTGWPGDMQFAGSSTPGPGTNWQASQWLSLAKLDDPKYAMTAPTMLTTYLDESNPRPGTADLYFSPDWTDAPAHDTQIDYSLPSIRHIDYSDGPNDAIALLLIGATPGAALYCGLRVLFGPHTAPRLLRPLDILFGLLGFVYSAISFLLYVVAIPLTAISVFKSDLATESLFILLPILFLIALVNYATLSSSTLVLAPGAYDKRPYFLKGRKWDFAMGSITLAAGLLVAGTLIYVVMTG